MAKPETNVFLYKRFSLEKDKGISKKFTIMVDVDVTLPTTVNYGYGQEDVDRVLATCSFELTKKEAKKLFRELDELLNDE